MACAADRERALKEVAQVYERIKIQQPLLLHCSGEQPSPETNQLLAAHTLLGEALQALKVALSVIEQQPQQPALVQPQLPPPYPGPDDSKATGTTARRGKRQRSSWLVNLLTAVPYDDGYEWRKYGEKKINGASYTRCYFRCTHKYGTGCQATKHVQQQQQHGGSTDPPMFHVTYNNKHSCQAIAAKPNSSSGDERAMPMPMLALVQASDDALPFDQIPISMKQFCGTDMNISPPPPPNANAAMNIDRETPVVLPPMLVEASDLPFDQTSLICQQEPLLFPICRQHFCGTSVYCHGGDTTSSSTSSSCMAPMATAEASDGDDPFYYDLDELFALGHSDY